MSILVRGEALLQGAVKGAFVHAFTDSRIDGRYAVAIRPSGLAPGEPWALDLKVPTGPRPAVVKLFFFYPVLNKMGEPGVNYGGECRILTAHPAASVPIDVPEDGGSERGSVENLCVTLTPGCHRPRAVRLVGSHALYSRAQGAMYPGMVARSNAWWRSSGITSLVPSLSDVHLPYLNGEYNRLPGWAYMTILPEGLTDQTVFANLLATAALRRGLCFDRLERMCADPGSHLRPLSGLVAEALHIVSNFYTYMRDYNNRPGRGDVPVERFSASVRAVASGDCEDLSQEISYLCEEWRAGQFSHPLARAGAVVLQHYVGAIILGAVRLGRMLVGKQDDGMDAHAYFALIPAKQFNGMGRGAVRVAGSGFAPGLPVHVLDGTNLNCSCENVGLPTNCVMTGASHAAWTRLVEAPGGDILRASRAMRTPAETRSFYKVAESALIRDPRVRAAGARVFEVYFYMPRLNKYGAYLDDIRAGHCHICHCYVPSREEVVFAFLGVTLMHPVPAHRPASPAPIAEAARAALAKAGVPCTLAEGDHDDVAADLASLGPGALHLFVGQQTVTHAAFADIARAAASCRARAVVHGQGCVAKGLGIQLVLSVPP